MLVYVDQNMEKDFEHYDSIEEKNKIIEAFHHKAKQEMRDNDYLEFRYAIIDFHADQSIVYIMNREITETFSITGC